MCNYSLECLESREAIEGERLVTRRFYTGSLGFVSPDQPDVAVCLREGVELVLRDIPASLQARLQAGEEAVARFAFLSKPRKWWNFWSLDVFDTDGLVFDNGKSILISRLPDRLRADVLSATVKTALESAKQSASRVSSVADP
ncbi:MAG: hypothetical protein EHM23_32435 [Acidobacteria bacterium]|nr:MAG: hypothetical protein EHM23_32435 [Acidobacteriota bacterium]